ncbi:D-inositol 3-phosphate glycosyltransferase [Thalassocella blandensis]|nr:D-inositol 3-phosphate glycosyltransferase [Thalassocella blandensis]
MNAAHPAASQPLAETMEPGSSNLYETTAPAGFRPLKIALLGYRSHPFVGGQGIYVKYLSRALAALGHQVDVFSGPPYPELDNDITLHKVPSLDLYAHEKHIYALRWHHLKSFADTYEWWTMATGGFGEPYTFGRRIAKRLAHSDYDIIHDNQSLCTGLLTLQNLGHKVVSTIHHPIHRDRQLALDSEDRWGYRLLIKRWYHFLAMQEKVVSQLDNVITVSKVSQGDIAEHFKRIPARTPVIHNGIDTAIFRPLPDIKRQPFRLITTASADQPLKGLSYLLQAIAQLKPNYPHLHLCVIGKLKENGSTAKLLNELNLQDSVSFVSGISTEALVEQYAQSSIAVSPSLYEGFGLPAGEAMACGVPIIATDGGALPEVVGNAGIVVPKGNSQALAQQIAFLLDNPDQRQQLGTSAREHILQNFCWSKVAEQLTQYYSRILHSSESPC